MWPESTMDQHWPFLTTAVWLIPRVGKVTQKQTQEHTATVQWSRVVRSWAQGQARCRQVSTKLIRDVPWSSPPLRLTVQRDSEKQDSQCLSLQYYHVPSLLLSSTLNCTSLMKHCMGPHKRTNTSSSAHICLFPKKICWFCYRVESGSHVGPQIFSLT